jgi:hypothetical protein
VETTVDWARGVRIGIGLLDLVLDGQILPVGLKCKDAISFLPVDLELSKTEATTYRKALEQIQAGWTWTPAPRFRLSRAGDIGFILAVPEKASLRLATETGQKCPGHGELNVSQMLHWAAECRNDQLLLSHIMVGKVLPIVPRKGGCLAFRHVQTLPRADQKAYRRDLRRLEVVQDG